jgi:hypothetical protein
MDPLNRNDPLPVPRPDFVRQISLLVALAMARLAPIPGGTSHVASAWAAPIAAPATATFTTERPRRG